jgi:putative aldouronate transport system substrate-binding protein
MRRTVFIGLGLVALLVLVGCSRQAGGSGASAVQTGARTGAKGTIPISTTKPVLTMFIHAGLSGNTGAVSSFDYADNLFTKQLVDQTGIDLRISSATGADSDTRLNLMLSSGDYPDIITHVSMDIEYYSSQGIIIPLDREELQSYPHIKEKFDMFPFMMDKITASDGKIYALPTVNDCLHCTYSNGRTWIYVPWIRDTGRTMPGTLDEFTDFLRFVKNGDPNKNGKKDEIPLVVDGVANLVAKFAKSFMPFVYGDGYFGLALDDNKQIVEQYRDPAFRETLQYLNGLYREGLMPEDSFANFDRSRYVRNDEPLVAVNASSWGGFFDAESGSDRQHAFTVLPALRGPRGDQWATNAGPWSSVNVNYYITNKCTDVDLAIALFDYLQNDELAGENISGAKGIWWDDPDPDGKGFDGRPAAYKQLAAFGAGRSNMGWGDVYLNSVTQEHRVSLQTGHVEDMIAYQETFDPKYYSVLRENIASYQEFQFYATSAREMKYALPESIFIPPQNLSNDDGARVADINAVLDPFKEKAMVEFIIGDRNINNDADWNAYLAELDRLGSPEMVLIRQKYVR